MTRAAGPIWPAVLLLAAGTFALRYSFFFLFSRVGDVPPRLARALDFVAPAVLAALVAPALLVPHGSVAVVGNARLLAGLVGAVVAWRTESIVGTMVAGVVALALLQQVG